MGDASDWDTQTELTAVLVEFSQLIFKALGGKMDFVPIERPSSIKPPPEPETTVNAGEIMNFLKGI